MTAITLKGRNLGYLIKTSGRIRPAICQGGLWRINYDETRTIAVVAFGHIHFKECCMSVGVAPGDAVHISKPEGLDGLRAEDTLVLWHSTAKHHRLLDIRKELQERGFKHVNTG